MTTVRSGEDAASYLLDISTPSLYLNNAFRISGLDITCTLKEAKKYVRDREQCLKLGVPWRFQRRAFFPICAGQTIEDVRIAVDQKLANPHRRLIEELFWIWPDSKDDLNESEALGYLYDGAPHKAEVTWISQLNTFADQTIPLQILAVLSHLQALEMEKEIREGGCQNLACPRCHQYFTITAAEAGAVIACPNCQTKLRTQPIPECRSGGNKLAQKWKAARDYWSRLWISTAFWAELLLRAKALDAILGPEIINQVKKVLPEALLSLNVQLAIDFCSRGALTEASRHSQLVFSSNFNERYQISAVQRSTARMIDQIHQQANHTEQNVKINPKAGLQEAINLLDKTRSDLRCFAILDCHSLNLGYAACDAVAVSALNAMISYHNTTHDSESLLRPTEELLEIAKSESIISRISESLAIIKNIVHENAIGAIVKPIFDMCDRIILALERTPEGDTQQIYLIYARFRDEIFPKLNDIKSKHGEKSDEFILASRRCAYCLRAISIDIHNKCNDIAKTREALSWARTLCEDQEFLDLYARDLQTVRQNEAALPAQSKNILSDWWGLILFIGILAIVGMTKLCDSSSSPGQSLATTLTSRSYNYSTPSSSKPQSSTPYSQPRPQSQSSATRSGLSDSSTRLPSSASKSIPNSTSSSRSSTSFSSARMLLGQEIELGKFQARQMEDQIDEMDKQLKTYDAQMNRYELLNQIEEYNRLVPIYNSLLERRKRIYSEYSSLVDEINAKVERYNRGY